MDKPDDGNIRSRTANRSINSRPSQKVGTAAPAVQKTATARSINDPRKRAARPPRTKVITIAAAMVVEASINVYGNAFDNSAITGLPVINESPKSPCSTPPRKRPYRCQIGSLRPSC